MLEPTTGFEALEGAETAPRLESADAAQGMEWAPAGAEVVDGVEGMDATMGSAQRLATVSSDHCEGRHHDHGGDEGFEDEGFDDEGGFEDDDELGGGAIAGPTGPSASTGTGVLNVGTVREHRAPARRALVKVQESAGR
ncbi:hypothetical protein [Herbidospora cretacea]|uniref:hypothetical protein n=1 Tax=Herbidospora cretacea TaxID=28444 RepID=UPI0012FC9C1F|nr:hypothetical protein [Herbidospora cretacea]